MTKRHFGLQLALVAGGCAPDGDVVVTEWPDIHPVDVLRVDVLRREVISGDWVSLTPSGGNHGSLAWRPTVHSSILAVGCGATAAARD